MKASIAFEASKVDEAHLSILGSRLSIKDDLSLDAMDGEANEEEAVEKA